MAGIESGLIYITGSHVHCRNSIISETVHDTDIINSHNQLEVICGKLNSAISDDLEWLWKLFSLQSFDSCKYVCLRVFVLSKYRRKLVRCGLCLLAWELSGQTWVVIWWRWIVSVNQSCGQTHFWNRTAFSSATCWWTRKTTRLATLSMPLSALSPSRLDVKWC